MQVRVLLLERGQRLLRVGALDQRGVDPMPTPHCRVQPASAWAWRAVGSLNEERLHLGRVRLHRWRTQRT